jgi:small subunit ribosomal protein S1
VPQAQAPQPDAPKPAASEADKPKAGVHKPAKLDADVEAEIDAAMRELGLGSISDADTIAPVAKPAIHGPRVIEGGREYRTGVIVSVGPTDVFVEFGPKELGVVERNQWKDDKDLPKVGDEFEVAINRYEPSESLFICSLPGAVQKADWELLQPGQVVEARVTGAVKGGLELEVATHRAFMPASQVAIGHIDDLSVFVGEKFTCKISRIDRRGKGNIVLSRRDVLEVERRERAEELKKTLQEGQVVEGTVRKIMPFGAFVDLGGIDGLVHISDLTYERTNYGENQVSKYITEGQRIKVQVLSIDWEKNRISLGMKQIQADPFAEAAEQIVEGAEVTGRVTRLADFGAFVELSPGVEGLIHISELAWHRVNKCEDVVKPDEVVTVKVLRVEKDSRRIGLSLKATTAAPKQAAKGRHGTRDARTAEEIAQEDPAFRRLKEKFGKQGFKGGLG